MIKRLGMYLLLFIFLYLVHSLFLYKYIRYSFRQTKISSILSEISHEKINPQQQFRFSAIPYSGSYQTDIVLSDAREANLRAFFRKYNSPLYDYSGEIIQKADENKFDYRLLPAIAMQESNLCKYIPENSYNCWGWGIYGNTVTRFSSYSEAIDTVSRGIKKHYIDKGLVTASDIMAKYTPSSNGSWAHGVNTFLRALE